MQIFTATKSDLESCMLSEEESKHCLRVLRKSVGEKIKITNGLGDLLTAEIIDTRSKKCKFKVIDIVKTKKNTPPLHIAIAPTKNIDRFEFFIEKCTEIGIAEITPLVCFHSERKAIKFERLNKIITSACKQSKNYHFPILNDLTHFNDVIKMTFANKLIAHCENHEKTALKNFQTDKSTLILIGPEGDFSKQEIDLALQNDFNSISLGESRLRTETAGIVACTIANLNYEK